MSRPPPPSLEKFKCPSGTWLSSGIIAHAAQDSNHKQPVLPTPLQHLILGEQATSAGQPGASSTPAISLPAPAVLQAVANNVADAAAGAIDQRAPIRAAYVRDQVALEHLRQSAVVIVPLRIGGGTRLKIYEAMATAKAVVSTTVGAEGLDVHHGRDIILADDPRSFAQAVIMLLRDPDLRRRYEKAAVETAARYDWPAIGERFSEVLQSVAEKKSLAVRTIPARLAEKKA